MLLDQAYALVALLVALSIASERLVEIVKALIPPLSQKIENNPRKETLRQVAIQLLAVGAGIVTAYLAKDFLPTEIVGKANALSIIGLGLCASGGSGFWNSILSYLLKVKEIKQVKADALKGLLSTSPHPVPPTPNSVLPIAPLPDERRQLIQLNL